MRKKSFQVRHLIEPLSDLERLMRELSCPWMIIGGMAASLLGKPRFTADIDLVILIGEEDLSRILKSAQKHGFSARIKNPIEFARENKVLLLCHRKTSINIDISLGLLPFEKNAIKNRKRYKIGRTIFYLPRAEDLIIFKAVAQRPQDMLDIQEIINSSPKLNTRYIRKIVKEFAAALEMPEIWDNLQPIIFRKIR